MVNSLEERLGVVQRQKAYLKKEMKKETNRKKLMQMAVDIADLTVEEDDILHRLGLK